MCNGVAGLLEERVVDLSTLLTDDLDIELLKRTPSSFLGSCRYKLPDWHEDETVYKKLFAILEKLNIGYFFYIGGNDSMDTIGKLAEYGERIQSDIRFMGVPKTIDNDLMVTDHTPGYGSAAKYIGVVMKEIIRDATVYGTKYVTVVEIMGRNAGWLTAAAALAKSDDCEGVDMICLPEVPFNVERFVEKVRVMQEKKPSIVIAVSEGVKLEDGRYVCELADDVHAVDAFGHKALTGTARYLANVVARNLDTKTRCIELSTLQRCAGHLTSRTDITEAYQVGGAQEDCPKRREDKAAGKPAGGYYLYTTATCPNCHIIKPILEKAGIPFVERDAEQYLQEVTALGLTHAPSLVVQANPPIIYAGVARIKEFLEQA